MDRGTIVLTKFPFTDFSATKRQPALVLSPDNPADPDVIVAFISSVIPATSNTTDFVLETSHPDFDATGLNKTSVFKMDKLATLDKAIFTGELGKATAPIYAEFKA
ncbi:type II toxin-antitoxin system PemK/MazF family toxin [Spirosoma arcticum]